MSRTRINVESSEEYMTEEPFEHHNSGVKDAVSSDVQEITTNDEGFTDCDDADADENEEVKFVAHSLLIAIYDDSSS